MLLKNDFAKFESVGARYLYGCFFRILVCELRRSLQKKWSIKKHKNAQLLRLRMCRVGRIGFEPMTSAV